MYCEWYGIWTTGRADDLAEHYFNIGIDFLVTDDFVLDVRVGKGLSDDADDFFSGVGGGFRY